MALAPAGAGAQPTTGASAAGEWVDVVLHTATEGDVLIQSGPQPVAAGEAPPAFDEALTTYFDRVKDPHTGKFLKTDSFTVTASSPLAEGLGVMAEADSAQPSIVLTGRNPLFTLDAEAITVTARIDGGCGGLTASASTRFDSAVAGGPFGAGLTIASEPAPNTVLLDRGDLRVVLNETLVSGGPETGHSVAVNGVHVYLHGLYLQDIGTLDGEIILGRAVARCDCTGGAAADVVLSGSAYPDPVFVGGDLTYSFTVVNQGPGSAAAVQLDAQLPAEAPFVSAASTLGSCTGSGPVACTLGDLAAAESATIQVVVRAQGGGFLTATGAVSSPTSDLKLENNQVTLVATVASE